MEHVQNSRSIIADEDALTRLVVRYQMRLEEAVAKRINVDDDYDPENVIVHLFDDMMPVLKDMVIECVQLNCPQLPNNWMK